MTEETHRRRDASLRISAEALATPPRQPFEQAMQCHREAVALLAKVTNTPGEFQEAAARVLAEWHASLAPLEVMEQIATSTELELYSGAVHSPSEAGTWVQCWAWVPSSKQSPAA